jgi:hypothetical protein
MLPVNIGWNFSIAGATGTDLRLCQWISQKGVSGGAHFSKRKED